MMGAGLLNTTRSFKLVALKFCVPGSITIFHKFIYVFFYVHAFAWALTHRRSGQGTLLTQQEIHCLVPDKWMYPAKTAVSPRSLLLRILRLEGRLCLSNRNSVPMT